MYLLVVSLTLHVERARKSRKNDVTNLEYKTITVMMSVFYLIEVESLPLKWVLQALSWIWHRDGSRLDEHDQEVSIKQVQ